MSNLVRNEISEAAISSHDIHEIKRAIEGGAIPNQDNFEALVQVPSMEILGIFIDAGLDPNIKSGVYTAITPLELSIFFNDLSVARSIIEKGGDVNPPYTYCRTLLDLTPNRGMKQLLIDNGAQAFPDNLKHTTTCYLKSLYGAYFEPKLIESATNNNESPDYILEILLLDDTDHITGENYTIDSPIE